MGNLGCVQADLMAPAGRPSVETVAFHRRMTKIRKGLSYNSPKIVRILAPTEEIIEDANCTAKNIFKGEVAWGWESMESVFSPKSERHLRKFPKWHAYRKCNFCTSEARIRLKKGDHKGKDVCKHCSDFDGVKNNERTSSIFSNSKTLTNLLAMTALDLSAPASDALVKNRKNTWIQLAGHSGSFAPAGPNTIWKKRMTNDNNETNAYQALMYEDAKCIAPIFYREVEHNNEYFIEMEDLLQHFTDPNLMDIKMGRRTYLESEVKNPVLRKDLYEKMIKVQPDAPTNEEREQGAITKLRYMQFREQLSTTAEFGFRIEGYRLSGEPPVTHLEKINLNDEVKEVIRLFLCGHKKVIHSLINRLQQICEHFNTSPFLLTHELIGSSLLILCDSRDNCGAWLIDFAKTLPVEDGKVLTHTLPWTLGNHEDGYVFGLQNLIKILTEMEQEDDS